MKNYNFTCSVALATYNGQSYLEEQLNSILAQTVLPNEVIISDDNSVDDTILIIKEFKKKAPFKVDLLINKGKGFNENFENALTKTTGEIVFICDQDDVWLKNKIKHTINYFKRNKNKELVIHDLEFCNSNLEKTHKTKIQRFKKNNKSLDNFNTGMATAIRGRFLKSCVPFSKSTNYDTWIHLCSRLLNVRGVHDNVLSLYRRHEDNATRLNPMNSPNTVNYFYYIKSVLKKNNYSEIQKESILIHDLIEYVDFQKKNMDYANVNFEKIEHDLQKKLKFSLKRKKIVNQMFLSRLINLSYLYIVGGYSDKSGLKTLIRDIFFTKKNNQC